jgi:hypothetical protein
VPSPFERMFDNSNRERAVVEGGHPTINPLRVIEPSGPGPAHPLS